MEHKLHKKKKAVEQSREGKGEVCEREHAAGVEVASAEERKEAIEVQRGSRLSSGRGMSTE